MKGWVAGGVEVLADNVKVTESNGKGLGWVVEEDFGGEAAVDGVEQGGVGRRAERARDVGDEGRVFEV